MESHLNLYGDVLPRSVGRSGANISSQRMDDLDGLCLDFALKLKLKGRRKFRALDVGCGDGIQGLRLALIGYESHLYDKEPLPEKAYGPREIYQIASMKFHRHDLTDSSKKSLFPSNGVDICYSQRFIHYLRFTEAVTLLTRIRNSMARGGHLFISASGLASEIGEAHPHRNQPVERRFERLELPIREKHSIFEKICVYSPDDLERLCVRAGFITIDLWQSGFGNVKGIFSKEE